MREGWREAPLERLVKFLGRGKAPTYSVTDSRWFAVNQKCVRDGRVDLSFVRAHDAGVRVPAEAVLQPGDLCVNSTGTGTIGRVGLWRGGDGETTYFADTHVTIVRPRQEAIISRFLAEVMASPEFQQRMEIECFSGSTNQVELSRSALGRLTVSFPPIEEQRRIAAPLSAIDAQITAAVSVAAEAQRTLAAVRAELLCSGLPGFHREYVQSSFGRIPGAWKLRPLGTIVRRERREVDVIADREYREIGVRSHGRGVFHKEALRGSDLGSKSVFWVEPGALVINIVFAWEGAVAATSEAERGMIGSHRFLMLRPLDDVLDLTFVRLLLQSPRGVRLLGALSPGGAGRNRTLNQSALLAAEIPLPPLHEQQRIGKTVVALEAGLRREEGVITALREVKGAVAAVLLRERAA